MDKTKKTPAAKKTASSKKTAAKKTTVKTKKTLPEKQVETLIPESPDIDKQKQVSPAKQNQVKPVKKMMDLLTDETENKEIEEIDPVAIERGDHPMSVIEHLDEFRTRFLKVFVVFIVLTCAAFYYSDSIVYYINKPFLEQTKNNNLQLHIFKLTGGFMLKFKASAGAAILIMIPYVLFHIWRFIAPAIGKTERMFSRLTIISAVLLFYSGVAFVFFLLIPFSIKMFLSFIGVYMSTTIGADDYLNMIFIFCLIMGILFEMPIIMLILTKFGIVTPQLLITKRKYAIVIIWIIASVVSPPDVISMVLCGIPLMFLYEVSIILSRFMLKRKKRKELSVQ